MHGLFQARFWLVWTLGFGLAMLLAGCAGPNSRADAEARPGQVEVQLRWDKPQEFRLEKPAEVYVDGSLSGTCPAPGQVLVSLPAGEHKIAVDLPWVWQLTGERRERAIAMAGEQTVIVFGQGRSQTVVFEREKLRVIPIQD